MSTHGQNQSPRKAGRIGGPIYRYNESESVNPLFAFSSPDSPYFGLDPLAMKVPQCIPTGDHASGGEHGVLHHFHRRYICEVVQDKESLDPCLALDFYGLGTIPEKSSLGNSFGWPVSRKPTRNPLRLRSLFLVRPARKRITGTALDSAPGTMHGLNYNKTLLFSASH